LKRWLAILIPALLVMIAAGYGLGSHVLPQSVQDNLANAAAIPDVGGMSQDNVATIAVPDAGLAGNAAIPSVAPVPDNNAVPVAPAAPVQANAAGPATNDRDDDDDPDADAQAQADIADAIRTATLEALDSGEPAHWHKDGLSGDISVSEARSTTAGTCRNVSATMGTQQNRQQSSVHLWCQPSDDDDWAPQ
jgi:hypothetical protein